MGREARQHLTVSSDPNLATLRSPYSVAFSPAFTIN